MTQEQRPDIVLPRRAMVVVAHCDDAEFGCAGTIAKWCAQGVEVIYVIITDSGKGTGDRSHTPAQVAATRRDEQLAAGKILGLKEVVFLNHPDGYVQPTLDVRRDIAREIRRYRPDVVITTSPLRSLNTHIFANHPDHIAAGEATLSAVYPAARDHLTFPELVAEGHEPHNVREVWVMGAENPDYWVDVTDSMETAVKALQAHASQVGSWDAAGMLQHWKQEDGKHIGVQHAEAFKRIVIEGPTTLAE
jgi:LmbE family N-acetylglucosaminyl deacetylase